MIDDAAAPLGQRQHRAHALDIGGEPAIERLRRLADQLAGLLDRLGEIDLLAGDLRARRRQLAFEPCDRFAAAVLQYLEALIGALDDEIVRKRPAKRIGHVLENCR